ncbi:hypothetical protein OAO48_04770, partial [Alphaproteobacteria bacterium]|nr:hypothetical protein [Alphaproteobacteria bacterium]
DGRQISFFDLAPSAKLQVLKNVTGWVLSGSKTDANLDSIKLFIKFKNLEQIYSDRDQAMKVGVNVDPTEVPCKVSTGDEVFKCSVRLKGDLGDHWWVKDRISLKIKVKKGYIFGHNSFSLQKPSARQFPFDQVFHSLVTKMGGHSSDMQNFVGVEVNGQRWGVMNLEPDIDTKFLEVKDLKRLGVYRISNQDVWHFDEMFGDVGGYYPSDPSIILSLKGSDKVLVEKTDYLRAFSHIKQALWKKKGAIFDREMMIDNLMLSLAWGRLHTLHNSNSYYTWNQYTRKLEPILTDQLSWQSLNTLLETYAYDLPYEYRMTFKDTPMTEDEYNIALKKVRNLVLKTNLIEEVNKLKTEYFPGDIKFTYEPVTENLMILDKKRVAIRKFITSNRTKNNIKSRDASEVVTELERFHHVDAYQDGLLRIYNLTSLPLKLQSVSNKTNILSGTYLHTIPPSKSEDLSFLEIQTDWDTLDINRLNVVTRFGENLRTEQPKLILASVDQNSRSLKNLGCINSGDICILQDDLHIKDSVIYDRPVHIRPGVTYRLESGADVFFSNGIEALGDSDMPILFVGDKTGGVYIQNAKKQLSKIVNVNFISLGAMNTNDYQFTGTVNGYGGKFFLDKIHFKNGVAEDQLNIVHALVEIGHMSFDGAVSDAFDCDFCKGQINELHFNSIGGDGLDVSGSNLRVNLILAKDIKDKAVSVGERSELELRILELENVGTGVASKDGSRTDVSSVVGPLVKFDLFMTYIKKPFYKDITSLNVEKLEDTSSVNGAVCVRERNTLLQINGEFCDESDLSVEDLYKGRMKK